MRSRPSQSPIPHLFVDTAISPNTDGTFHFGLDLMPRLDLGASLDYTEAVYGPLTEPRAVALGRPGVMPVPSLGPLQWSIRSPWMVAAIVLPDALRGLSAVTDAYVDRWLSLVAEGLPPVALADAEWQDVSRRDHLNRAAMFAARTNPVWGLLDRLVGEQAVADMRGLLVSAGSPEPLVSGAPDVRPCSRGPSGGQARWCADRDDSPRSDD